MNFEVGAATDTGMVRDANQDRYLVHGNFVAVADGMGGHAGGELAAETAVEELRRFPTMLDTGDIVDGIQNANREVLQAAERTGMTNMGTTVVAALLRPDRRSVTVANVGDSRAYLLSRGELDQITQDHSLVEDLLRAGKINEEEARDHPHRNVVTRVLGIGEDPEVDTFDLAVGAGDMILLASDGLFNEVDHHALATILSNADDLDEAATRLVERANQNGGHDNITVVIVRLTDDDEPAVSQPASAADIAVGPDDTTQVFPGTPLVDPERGGGALTDSLPHRAPYDDASAEDTVTFEGAPSAADTRNLGAEETASMERPSPLLSDHPDDPIDTEVLQVDVLDGPDNEAVLDPPTEELPVVVKRKRNWVRALIFAFCVFALLGLGVGGVVAYGRNAWFVETVANEVVIQQGRPGGVLFIQPQAVRATGIDINDLNPGSRNRVTDQPVFSSLEEAEAFVDQLELRTLE